MTKDDEINELIPNAINCMVNPEKLRGNSSSSSQFNEKVVDVVGKYNYMTLYCVFLIIKITLFMIII